MEVRVSRMMTVSVLRSVGQVGVEERPVPQPAADEVLVRIGSVGVCGSDVHYYEHGRIGPYVVDSPLVLGHEAGGVVTEVGQGVTSLRVGQRVSIEPGVPCRHCPQCLAGRYNLCPEVRFFATPPYDGAFSQYVAMPASFVYPVPDSISDDAAGLLEPLSVGVWACRRAHVSPGSTVLVTGAGPIGLIAAQTARAYGADAVTVTDVNPHRLRVAEDLGLGTIDVSNTTLADSGIEADVLLECSGNARATWDAVSTMARAGRVVLVGMGGDSVNLPLSYVQDRELVVTGAFRYANTWPTAIQLAASGRVDLDGMVTGHYGLDDVEAALTASKNDPTALKVIVRPGD
ncbi:NAD(P)-dependent alcohol dehydrogenase [Lapillicoccus sp.]|uniref:NAD(P)-dependent alcohol dehydrogenase n=1 Tax=Lapillicoccus sp. TaxID=1909287 RepID=UPI00387EC58C